MRKAGVGLGSGGFIVYDDSRWMVDIAWLISNFFSSIILWTMCSVVKQEQKK